MSKQVNLKNSKAVQMFKDLGFNNLSGDTPRELIQFRHKDSCTEHKGIVKDIVFNFYYKIWWSLEWSNILDEFGRIVEKTYKQMAISPELHHAITRMMEELGWIEYA